ncbi:hypothetical protein DICPUDRAFT_41631 [Dictyostelium purpureum]|uniref:acetyl-CoA C-acetyltransferase n=1 Tax=Dictyostelium purpureum TaxID=5786 RepID=F1A0G5_DICPU|nr:uncharacterized protein DICPUDRAFT_41631 [Dictyostelium purpureum]EGC30312.1 hypothetical protein DICPUDRAFT_41631 [Dictyostelium purpureum]|eukprot:XP_003293163.1 hypothetical protein DICPUDRAFT_41631 [Dictyostelium purpureum]
MYSTKNLESVVIVSACRTPIGTMGGSLSTVPGTKLSSLTIEECVKRAGINKGEVDEVIMGNVISANVGQAPARQCALGAGLELKTVTTTINKVCSSGLKAITLGTQSIMLGHSNVVLAGGFESMSQVPFYSDKMRFGAKYGNQTFIDGLVRDGLADAYNGSAMGVCGDDCAAKYNITREEQDKFAIDSYNRAIEAQKSGYFTQEIVPVPITARGKTTFVTEDEEPKKVLFDKIPTLKPAFTPNGTVTAANASKINDGASSVLLMSESHAKKLGVKPLARIIGYADSEQAPIEFPTAPAKAIPKALKNAGIDISQVDLFEINEAFSVVGLANMKLLNIEHSKLNVNGGAVALGHPIGSSGCRIVVTLTHLLQQKNLKYGVAAICNGGGGASALVLEAIRD